MFHSSKYFVLNPRSKKTGDSHAQASRKAMEVYAREIFNKDPDLSNSLLRWVERENRNERGLPLEPGAFYSRWIEKKVLTNPEKPDYNWFPVIKCSTEFIDEMLLFFQQTHHIFEYRIAPE
jgi:hypothetical protein